MQPAGCLDCVRCRGTAFAGDPSFWLCPGRGGLANTLAGQVRNCGTASTALPERLRSASRRPQVDWPPPGVELPEPTRLGEVVWLEPYPDVLLEGLADVTLTAHDGGTLVAIAHSGLPDGERPRHAAGGRHYLARLSLAATGADLAPHVIPDEIVQGAD
jgi:hypothetical protein